MFTLNKLEFIETIDSIDKRYLFDSNCQYKVKKSGNKNKHQILKKMSSILSKAIKNNL